MKTVMIFDQLNTNLEFAVLDGDYTRFNGVYINMGAPEGVEEESYELLSRELSDLMYDKFDGHQLIPTTLEFPVEAVREGASVIVAGFLP